MVVAALVAAVVVTAAGIAAVRQLAPLASYSMSSASMEPTLTSGDVVLVLGARGLCRHPAVRPGDVVVFRKPLSGQVRYLHRLVAGPGATVSMRDGLLTIDGRPVSRRLEPGVRDDFPDNPPDVAPQVFRETLPDGVSYLTRDLGPDGDVDNFEPVRLGPDQWFELGDNRDNARDSRSDGPVAGKDLCGVAAWILTSKDSAKVGSRP